MNKIYENKIFTLILSLLLALILFLFVKTENYRDNPVSYFQNISEISTETIYNVPVYVEGDVQDYYVSGLPESVSVELTGPHNILEQTLESNEFRVVTEDLTNIGVGTHYIQLSLDNISENISYRISPSSVNINVEELQSQAYPVEVDFDASKVADGYEITDIIVEPAQVELTGSQENIALVNRVFAQVDLPEDVNTTYSSAAATVMIRDENGNILDIGIEPAQVSVTIKIEPVGKKVPVQVTIENENPNLTYSIKSIEPATVTLQGPAEVIENINQVQARINANDITSESIQTINISPPAEDVTIRPAKVTIQILTNKNDGADGAAASNPSRLEDNGETSNPGNSIPEENSSVESTIAPSINASDANEQPSLDEETETERNSEANQSSANSRSESALDSNLGNNENEGNELSNQEVSLFTRLLKMVAN